MSASGAIQQRNQDATVYVGNLDEKVNDELLWELMLQAGPVVNVHVPKDKITGKHMTYGFVEYRGEDDAEYAIKVLNMIKVVGKPIKVNKVAQDKKVNEVGANLFIGNLDPDVDEKLLYDTFSAFGGITQTPKIMRDPDLGTSKGYGFCAFDTFESSDMAIECMNGQYLCNRSIVVQYAFKKDTPGERHGSQAERMMAASALPANRFKPNTNFSGGDGDMTSSAPLPGQPPAPGGTMPGTYGGVADMSGMMLQGGMQGMVGMGGMGMGIPVPPPPPMQGGYNMYSAPQMGYIPQMNMGQQMYDPMQFQAYGAMPQMPMAMSVPPPPPPQHMMSMSNIPPPPPAPVQAVQPVQRGMAATKPAWMTNPDLAPTEIPAPAAPNTDTIPPPPPPPHLPLA